MATQRAVLVRPGGSSRRGFRPELAALGADRLFWREQLESFFAEHRGQIVAARAAFGIREVPGRGRCELLVGVPESLGEEGKDVSFLSNPDAGFFLPRLTTGIRRLLFRSATVYQSFAELQAATDAAAFRMLYSFFKNNENTSADFLKDGNWAKYLLCVLLSRVNSEEGLKAPKEKIDVIASIAGSPQIVAVFSRYCHGQITFLELHRQLALAGLDVSEIRLSQMVKDKASYNKILSFVRTYNDGKGYVDPNAASAVASATMIAASHDVSFVAYGSDLSQVSAVQERAKAVAGIVAPRIMVAGSSNGMNRGPGQRTAPKKEDQKKRSDFLGKMDMSKFGNLAAGGVGATATSDDAEKAIAVLTAELERVMREKEEKKKATEAPPIAGANPQQLAKLAELKAALQSAGIEEGGETKSNELFVNVLEDEGAVGMSNSSNAMGFSPRSAMASPRASPRASPKVQGMDFSLPPPATGATGVKSSSSRTASPSPRQKITKVIGTDRAPIATDMAVANEIASRMANGTNVWVRSEGGRLIEDQDGDLKFTLVGTNGILVRRGGGAM